MRLAAPRIAVAVVLPALMLGVSGCAALAGPAESSAHHRAAASAAHRRQQAGSGPGSDGSAQLVARANRTHEVPTPARPQRTSRGWPTPEAAVRAFAAAYVNWTASNVAARLRALARESVGQARATLQVQAAEIAADTELHRGRIANSGAVEAVGPLAGSPQRYVVVTRERTSAADDAAYRGLGPEWHVSVATVRRVGGRWVISGWQPQS